MAQPRLQAAFFIDSSGAAFPRAATLTAAERKVIYDRDGGHCRACKERVRFGGNTVSPFDRGPAPGHIDHIIPRSRGGQNDHGNLRLLCITCNAAKGAK